MLWVPPERPCGEEGRGGSKEDWFFYPTASPTVAFRNGTDSLESLCLGAQPGGGQGSPRGFLARPGGARVEKWKEAVFPGESLVTLKGKLLPK